MGCKGCYGVPDRDWNGERLDQYCVGEQVYLKFKVTSREHNEFEILNSGDNCPKYDLTVNGKKIKTQEKAILDDDHIIRVLFAPQVAGTHILDIWYNIKTLVTSGKEGDDTENPIDAELCERRTARFMLAVVR